jgi:hypothetical protein
MGCQSQSYVTTDGQSASLSWCQAPIWGLRPNFYYCQAVTDLLTWGALSDERTGLRFTIAAGPRQRSYSWVRVPREIKNTFNNILDGKPNQIGTWKHWEPHDLAFRRNVWKLQKWELWQKFIFLNIHPLPKHFGGTFNVLKHTKHQHQNNVLLETEQSIVRQLAN